ncbi:MAG TPA: hypothetical protein VEC16_01525 [Alphaproteobacteria bacterium]|nr:hypothetical protein [Alphaproteobacteria bacterium]
MTEKSYLTDSIEEIKQRIAAIEATVNKIEALERAEIEYVTAIHKMETQELEGLDRINTKEDREFTTMNKMRPLKYNDLMMWKGAIWENCPNKILIDSKTMVLFNCRITGKVCSFGNCPRNLVGNND